MHKLKCLYTNDILYTPSRPLDVFFQLKVDQTSYKPLKFIRVEDNNENIKDLLKALKVNPGSEKQLSLEVVIDVGREAIKFKSN